MDKNSKRKFRHKRVRSKVIGSSAKPRLSIFRSNKNIFIQLIDDQIGKTIISASGTTEKSEKKKPGKSENNAHKNQAYKGKIALGFLAGEAIAKKAMEKKITKVVFDRGGYKYHGIIKAVAEGARKGGLKF